MLHLNSRSIHADFVGRYDIVEAFYAILNGVGHIVIPWAQLTSSSHCMVKIHWITIIGNYPNDGLQSSGTSPVQECTLTNRILCDDEVFDITNRWRATRGERAIPKGDNPIMRGEYGTQGMFGQSQ